MPERLIGATVDSLPLGEAGGLAELIFRNSEVTSQPQTIRWGYEGINVATATDQEITLDPNPIHDNHKSRVFRAYSGNQKLVAKQVFTRRTKDGKESIHTDAQYNHLFWEVYAHTVLQTESRNRPDIQIATFAGFAVDPLTNDFYTLTQYCEGDSLIRWINDKHDLNETLSFARSYANFVTFAHEQDFFLIDHNIHNVIVSKNDPVFFDFGAAVEIQNGQLVRRPPETHDSASAPEVAESVTWQTPILTPAVDVYGLGYIYYQIFSNHRVGWDNFIKDPSLNLILRDPLDYMIVHNPEIEESLTNLIRDMGVYEARYRMQTPQEAQQRLENTLAPYLNI